VDVEQADIGALAQRRVDRGRCVGDYGADEEGVELESDANTRTCKKNRGLKKGQTAAPRN